MAIDPRISLTAAPTINVGQRFGQALNNLRNMDLLEQQRTQAPMQNRLLELQTQLAEAQQPVNMQANLQNFVQQSAQQLKPLLDSGNTQQAANYLNSLKPAAQQLGLDVTEIDNDIAALATPEGLAQLKAENDSILNIGGVGQSQRPVQFGAQQTFKDSEGNLFFGTQKRNPNTGEVETAFSSVSGDMSQSPVGQLQLVSGLGQTAQEKQETEVKTTERIEEIKSNAKGKSEAIKAAVGQSVKAFEKIPLVRTAISNYDEAISALNSGAETGVIDQYLPSLTRASKELDNVIKRLGLDVVGNTTFGALSESELAFALKAAIPNNLQPEELKEWLTAKKNAQQKILSGLDEMATFLGDGTKTIADWNNRQAIKSLQVGSNDFSGFRVIR